MAGQMLKHIVNFVAQRMPSHGEQSKAMRSDRKIIFPNSVNRISDYVYYTHTTTFYVYI